MIDKIIKYFEFVAIIVLSALLIFTGMKLYICKRNLQLKKDEVVKLTEKIQSCVDEREMMLFECKYKKQPKEEKYEKKDPDSSIGVHTITVH